MQWQPYNECGGTGRCQQTDHFGSCCGGRETVAHEKAILCDSIMLQRLTRFISAALSASWYHEANWVTTTATHWPGAANIQLTLSQCVLVESPGLGWNQDNYLCCLLIFSCAQRKLSETPRSVWVVQDDWNLWLICCFSTALLHCSPHTHSHSLTHSGPGSHRRAAFDVPTLQSPVRLPLSHVFSFHCGTAKAGALKKSESHSERRPAHTAPPLTDTHTHAPPTHTALWIHLLRVEDRVGTPPSSY